MSETPEAKWVVYECPACKGQGWQNVEHPECCETCGGLGILKGIASAALTTPDKP